ncbi:hypothetical protein FOMPIDRAFT_1018356 [Fomitopsis schrenkii]|uniref:Uncharacterized protein n=1 Tax=Fomitopsis schrenkii TaxID=2126942 RepID=S8F6K5_FOMSC|nr:hypothetical protein FOMPIDRAFT_1018356 [Fomitopsis schrenkii]
MSPFLFDPSDNIFGDDYDLKSQLFVNDENKDAHEDVTSAPWEKEVDDIWREHSIVAYLSSGASSSRSASPPPASQVVSSTAVPRKLPKRRKVAARVAPAPPSPPPPPAQYWAPYPPPPPQYWVPYPPPTPHYWASYPPMPVFDQLPSTVDITSGTTGSTSRGPPRKRMRIASPEPIPPTSATPLTEAIASPSHAPSASTSSQLPWRHPPPAPHMHISSQEQDDDDPSTVRCLWVGDRDDGVVCSRRGPAEEIWAHIRDDHGMDRFVKRTEVEEIPCGWKGCTERGTPEALSARCGERHVEEVKEALLEARKMDSKTLKSTRVERHIETSDWKSNTSMWFCEICGGGQRRKDKTRKTNHLIQCLDTFMKRHREFRK